MCICYAQFLSEYFTCAYFSQPFIISWSYFPTSPQNILGSDRYSVRGSLNRGIMSSTGANVYAEDYISLTVPSNIVALLHADASLLSASE